MAKLKLNQEMIANLCKWIENGASDKDAITLEDITKETFYSWLKRGEQDREKGNKSIYSDFYDHLKKARVKFKMYHQNQIQKASQSGNWTASAWLLERKYFKEFGRKEFLRHEANIKYKVVENANSHD